MHPHLFNHIPEDTQTPHVYNRRHHHHHHHHHHVARPARIPLTLSRHPSLSSIASGRSSMLHPVSVQSCCIYHRHTNTKTTNIHTYIHGRTYINACTVTRINFLNNQISILYFIHWRDCNILCQLREIYDG